MKVAVLIIAMMLAFTTIVIIYRVEYQKRKVNPKKFDKEKARQEIVVLKNTVAYLDRQVILGNITKEQYHQEMAVVDFKVKELEKELLHGYAKEPNNG